MFSLEKQRVTLTNFNPRRELHGEDPQPAADLRVEATMSNDVLSQFSPTLKWSLYDKPDESHQGELIKTDGHLPRLRYPLMSPFKWEHAVVGAEVSIDHGLKNQIVLAGANVNDFRFEPEDGGTVKVSFRIQGHPDEKASGKLCTLIGNEVEITVTPPKEEPAGNE